MSGPIFCVVNGCASVTIMLEVAWNMMGTRTSRINNFHLASFREKVDNMDVSNEIF
jgi:hypothetical protein